MRASAPDKNQVRTLSGGTQVAAIRGEYIRLISLHRVLNVQGKVPDPWKALVVVIESENGSKAGLVVDELIGQQQVVVKSLLENFDAVRGISGATILGDGRVALILDLDGLCRLPERQWRRKPCASPSPDREGPPCLRMTGQSQASPEVIQKERVHPRQRKSTRQPN